jgi:hypothetical protein
MRKGAKTQRRVLWRALRGGLLLLMASATSAQRMRSGDFWRTFIKGPLSKPNADEYFVRTLKDAELTGGLAPYLEGTVLSVTNSKAPIRLLLSMEGTDTPDVMLVIEESAEIKAEPKVGIVVRFNGVVASKFTKEPFMLTFEMFDPRSSYLDIVNPR